MTSLVLFGRTRLAPSTGCALLVALVVTTLLQGRTFVAPIIPWDVTVLTSPLLPVVVAVVALRACEPVLHDLEVTAERRRTTVARLAWGFTLVTALAGLCAVSALVANDLPLGVDVPPEILALSFVSFFSVGLLGAQLLGADLGWIGPCLLVVALVFFGRDADQQPRAWAWVLHDTSAFSTWSVPAGLAAAALVYYWRVDTVGTLRALTGGRV